MKSFCLLLGVVGLAWVSVPACAQFHTIGAPAPRCKIQVVEPLLGQEEADAVALSDGGGVSKEVKLEEVPSLWVEHGLGVAFPLKSIKVTSTFGYRSDPFTGKNAMHGGLDLHARQDEVYAMFQGTVLKTGWDKHSGVYITLRHGDCVVSYCHLSELMVRQGDAVGPGDVVGITGNTGRSTGEHLHMTCRCNNRLVNPMVLIRYVAEVLRGRFG